MKSKNAITAALDFVDILREHKARGVCVVFDGKGVSVEGHWLNFDEFKQLVAMLILEETSMAHDPREVVKDIADIVTSVFEQAKSQRD